MCCAGVAAALSSPLASAGGARVYFEDTIPRGRSSSVTITTHRTASFRVVLRVPTDGRARLFLSGRDAPRGGPLIDTKTYGCEGAAGSFYCRGAYEPLPRGTYTWKVTWAGRAPAHVILTVRW